jgi:putative transposase
VRARDRTLLAEDLRRVYGAESRGEALRALEALREAWGSRYPGVVALWAGDSGAFLRFYGYPKALWPYLRSTNLMERFIREIRRGTKVRGQAEGLSCPQVSQRGSGVQALLPGSRASARILGRRGKLLREANILRLKGFSEARETLEKMLQERYAPRTQTL